MAYSNQEVIDYNAVDLAGKDGIRLVIDARNLSSGAFWVKWTGASAANATVKVQQNADKDDANGWIDVGSAVTVNAASGVGKVAVSNVDLPYLAILVTKNSETTALLTVRHYLKGHS